MSGGDKVIVSAFVYIDVNKTIGIFESKAKKKICGISFNFNSFKHYIIVLFYMFFFACIFY